MKEDEKETKDVLKPHQFDGIQEYDNQLPKWWLNGFYLSILFAIVYFAIYQLGSGPSLLDSYRNERRSELQAQAATSSEKKSKSEEELLALATNPEVLKLGKAQFETKCASCHLNDGGGLVGPNLTDDYWIHGNRMTDMLGVITNGVLAKGMPTWSAMMSEDEMIASAAYIRSLHGTKPANPKASEGQLMK